ncbi:MAG: 3-deoxy-manno-octulosonate cytidylyltransferase [Pirellulales bacterium]
MQSYVFIPARLASTRLPRKLLLRETGKTVLQHTYEAAQQAARPMGICVAAEDEEIAPEVRRFGGDVVVTGPNFASGTDRIAHVAAERRFDQIDIVVNLQADEPEISGTAIDQVIELLEHDSAAVMSTLATPIRHRGQFEDPACVKVVFDISGRALYFSRSPIPHVREWSDDILTDNPPQFFQHIGLYAYRRDFLLELARLPQTTAEHLEKLEQLRALESGHPVVVGTIDEPTCGIDTAADYRRFVTRMKSA